MRRSMLFQDFSIRLWDINKFSTTHYDPTTILNPHNLFFEMCRPLNIGEFMLKALITSPLGKFLQNDS
jgi:hypothetical protein